MNEAPSVVLLDEDEEPRASLQLGVDGAPSMSLFDRSGDPCIALAVNPDDTGLLSIGAEGKHRVAVMVKPDTSSFVSVIDGDSKMRAGVTLNADGRTGLTLTGPGGRAVASIGVDSDGSPYIMLRDDDGAVRCMAGTAENGAMVFRLAGKEDHPEIIMATQDGLAQFQAGAGGGGTVKIISTPHGSSVVLEDGLRRSRLTAAVDQNGSPSLLIADEDGVVIAKAPQSDVDKSLSDP